MNLFKLFTVTVIVSGLLAQCTPTPVSAVITQEEKAQINLTLDSFNRAAGASHFDEYFAFYMEDAIFTGTDATERWDKKEFMAWAKPHFDNKKAWNFSSLERHIYLDSLGRLAWFDELLNTQMKLCRGSGVLVKTGSDWKLKQYILSTTIPNEQLDSIAIGKGNFEDSIIARLRHSNQ